MSTTVTTTKTRFEPTQIADETFLVHDHHGEGTEPVSVALNTMVIRGAEPVVVDTGMAENRDQYLADVFSLVEPQDIRWVFISHDDVDHTGNVNALMAAAPNATLVIDWFMQERMGASLDVSPLRWRWVQDGDALDVGDRMLHIVRPPIFDSGTTRGLFDPATGVYWGSDAFASPMATPVRDVAELELVPALAGGDPHLRQVHQPLAGAGRRGSVPAHRRPHRGTGAPGDRRLPHAGDRSIADCRGHRCYPHRALGHGPAAAGPVRARRRPGCVHDRGLARIVALRWRCTIHHRRDQAGQDVVPFRDE